MEKGTVMVVEGGSSDAAGGDGTRERLRKELAVLQDRRDALSAGIRDQAGEVGDRGDEANALEVGDEIGMIDGRIKHLTALLEGGVEQDQAGGRARVPDGTEATLRFDDDTVQATRVVAIAEETAPDEAASTVTADSPLGLALVGHRTGDMINYSTPDGDVRAQIVSLEFPQRRG